MNALRLPFGLAPKPEEEGVRYADMYGRSVAAGIDLLLLFYFLKQPFEALTQRLFAGINQAQLNQIHNAQGAREVWHIALESGLVRLWLTNSFIQVAIIGLVMVGVQCLFRTTPGKWVMGLKILRAENLAEPEKWRYALRFCAYLPSAAPLMLGMIWASFNKQHRCWHDFLAGTVVINTRKRNWLWHDGKAFVKQRWQRRKQ